MQRAVAVNNKYYGSTIQSSLQEIDESTEEEAGGEATANIRSSNPFLGRWHQVQTTVVAAPHQKRNHMKPTNNQISFVLDIRRMVYFSDTFYIFLLRFFR